MKVKMFIALTFVSLSRLVIYSVYTYDKQFKRKIKSTCRVRLLIHDLCVDLLKSMQTCAFFLILHNTVHISITTFLDINQRKCYINCTKETTFIKIREI